MSELRSEFQSPENRSIPEFNTNTSTTNNTTTTTTSTNCSLTIASSLSPVAEKSSISSSSQSSTTSSTYSTECTVSSDSSIKRRGSESSDIRLEPFSGSRNRLEPSPQGTRRPCGPLLDRPISSGDEEITSADASSLSTSSSIESSPEARTNRQSSSCESDNSFFRGGVDHFSSDDDEFETEDEDSEDEESLTSLNLTPNHTSEVTAGEVNDSQSRKHQGRIGGLVISCDQQERLFRTENNRSSSSSSSRKIYFLRRFDHLLHRMSVKVAKYHKELCIVFLILASGIASLRSSPAKIRATSTPSPFFEEKDASYFVQDNYMGEYVELANKQIPYYPSFLFYYAPWDSESVASRSVFLNVAKHFFFTYHGRVKFVAINCWWPGGQCRKNYKNLSHYPIFVAHVGKAAGIIYNGPIRLEPMIKFINSLLVPLTRIDTEEELWRFRARHDVIMLAYFNFTLESSSEAYETYLQMALRTFEADPFNQVGFGLFLRPELAEKFFLTSSNAISLVLFNEIHTAKWHGGYSTQSLKGPVGQVAEWIIERTKSVPLTWVYALRNGFANRPIALGPHDFAQQLSKGPVFLLVTRRYFPSGLSPFYMQVKEVALDYFNCNRSGNVTKLRRTTHKLNSEWASLMTSVVQICRKKGSFQCQQLMPNINHWEKKRAMFKRDSLSHYENMSSALNFTGFSCVSDRQLKFLAIDPVDVPYFVKLGLSGLKSVEDESKEFTVDPMAFIIDSQNDVIMPVTSLNITDMAMAIYNYTTLIENIDSDTYPSKVFLSNNGQSAKQDPSSSIAIRGDNEVFETWGSDDFIKYVIGKTNQEESVLLLFTASFCGFCAVAVTHFVALSRFLAENYNDSLKIKLVKIDMFRNSLPPNLSPDRLPTIVFIPSWNRSDIRMYPENQEITAQGLLRFILSELDPKTRVHLSLNSPLCSANVEYCSNSSGGELSCRSPPVSLMRRWNSTSEDRLSCIRAGRTYVSNQIELLLQRLQEGEEAMFFQANGSLHPMAWNGRLLDRLRTMAVTLDVS